MMPALYLCATIIVYLGMRYIYQRTGYLLLMPIISCPLILIALLLMSQTTYTDYYSGGIVLTKILEPVTVAFAVPLYRRRHLIRQYLVQFGIIGSIAAFTAIASTLCLTTLLGVDMTYLAGMAPRSVTMPIALNVSRIIGGNPAITAVFVIATGIAGMIIAVLIHHLHRLKHPITKGLVFGMTAHGTGTARAYEEAEHIGVVSTVAMILMGIFTAIIAPFAVPWLTIHLLHHC